MLIYQGPIIIETNGLFPSSHDYNTSQVSKQARSDESRSKNTEQGNEASRHFSSHLPQGWPQTRLASTTVCPGHRYRLMPRQHNPVSTSTNILISRWHCGNLNSAEVISDMSDQQTQVVDEEFCLVAWFLGSMVALWYSARTGRKPQLQPGRKQKLCIM